MNEFLILFVLAKNSANIYEIKKYIDKNLTPFLEVGTGALIPALKRLEKAGCVESEKTLSDGGLRRSVYSITDIGKEYINQYLKTDIVGAQQIVRREIEVLIMLLDDEYFLDEQKNLLIQKIKVALENNIKLIKTALKYGKMNTEYLNMELVYSEAKLRMLNDFAADE